MDGIRQYVISLIAASLLCGILNTLFEEKSGAGHLVKLVSGIFLAFVVIRPIANIELQEVLSPFTEFKSESQLAVMDGKNMAREETTDIIIQRTKAYILERGKEMNVTLSVEITLNNDPTPVPVKVMIAGKVSPYTREKLSNILENNLGIAKENQIWIG